MDNNYFWSYSFAMRKGELDNEYYFYKDGKILHAFDKTKLKVNLEEFVSASDISEKERMEMLDKCPHEFKDQINEMLTINSK